MDIGHVMTKSRKSPLRIMYVLGFIFALGNAIPVYVNSTFLTSVVGSQSVGILYSLGALLTIIFLSLMPNMLRKFGNYNVTIAVSASLAILMGMLGFIQSPIIVAIIFVCYISIFSLLLLSLDIFLESYSTDTETGHIRSFFLTAVNIAFILSPTIAGFILTNGDFWKIYSIAASFILLGFFIIATNLRTFTDPVYEKISMVTTLKKVYRNADLYKVYMAHLLLKFFYAWMVIYTPIYLHEYLMFDWTTIGFIFTGMLLAFIIFEIPAGKLADERWGEKEIMSVGFVILAISSASLYFITSVNPFVWAIALFATRTGASLVEITTESYFFKQINAGDTQIIGFFRNSRPVAYLIAPLMATGLLYFFEFKTIFLILGAIMLFGLRYSLTIHDTK